MTCNITDFKCIFVNELVGDPILAILILGIMFFGYTSYKRVGLNTTLWLACAFFPVTVYFIAGNSFVFALITFVVSILAALFHNRITGNR